MNVKEYVAIAAIMTLTTAAAETTIGPSVIPQNVTFVSPQPDGRVDLAPNASPLGLQNISITFNSNVSVNTACKGEACIYILGDETPMQTVGVSGATVDYEQHNMGNLLFPYSCTSNGLYRVTIPEGFWQLSGGGLSGAFDLYYEIMVPQTISPSNPVQRELKEFRMEFPAYDEVRILDSSKFEFLRIASDEHYGVHVTEGKNEDGSPANYVLITLGQPVTRQGEYSLFIQADAAEGIRYGANYPEDPTDVIKDKNMEAIYRYVVSLADSPSIVPAEGMLEEFTTFELTVPSGADFWFVNDKAVNFLYPVNADGSLAPDPICRLTGRRVEDSEKILLTIIEDGEPVDSFSPKPGAYALQLASGLFSGSWDGEFINSAPFIYYYEATGGSSVAEIAGSGIKADSAVYTLDGKKVSDSKESFERKSMPKGIYISGGRKVLITSGK